jgi:hypothetical protein
LNESLLKCVDREQCQVTKLSSLSESPVRIDPVGQAIGILPIFLGGASTHLAKLADPAATSQQAHFCLPLACLCRYMLELELPETKLHLVFCQGFAVVWMPQVNGFLVLIMTIFVAIRTDVEAKREAKRNAKKAEALQTPC